MANFRQVNTFFWDDTYIENLRPEGKLLFLYLITNPLTNLAGSFEISLQRIAYQTGLPSETVSELLRSFESDGKCIYRDGRMLMINTIKHQHWDTHVTIRKGIENLVAASPAWVKERLYIAYEWLCHLKETNSTERNNGSVPPPVAADAAVEQEDPIESRIWKDGAELLKRSGVKDPRPLLGRLAKDHGKVLLAECIAATQAENPADPKAFLVATVKHRSAPAWQGVGKDDGIEKPFVPTVCSRCGESICLGGKACEDRAKAKEVVNAAA